MMTSAIDRITNLEMRVLLNTLAIGIIFVILGIILREIEL